MSLDLNTLRQQISEKTNKIKQLSSNNTSGSIFPFGSLKAGDTVAIRFVEDGDTETPNNVFWRERRTRTLEFPSIKQANGEVINNKCYVDIPAFNVKYDEILYSNLPENYLYENDKDVIQKRIKNFWGDSDEEKQLYYKFSRKKSYVFQGFVRKGYENNSALEPNKLYRFFIGEDLFNIIKTFFNAELGINNMPTDPDRGLDFILNVTSKKSGNKEYKDYSTSTWARMETPLTDQEKEVLANNKSFTLKNYIYTRPTEQEEQAMIEMFNASYNSCPYDVLAWSKFYKPNNIFFDADGNIKDLKGTSANNKARELPTNQTYQQPMNMVQQPQMTYAQPVQEQMQPQMPMQSQVQMSNTMSAPQIISQHTETVSGDNPKDVIQNILGKYNIQQN